MEQQAFQRRSPHVETAIKNLRNVKGRVAILGTVVNKNKELFSFVVDDGEANVLVLTNNIDEFEQLKEGKLARVLGRVVGEKEEVEVLADLIQDFSLLDYELLKRVTHV